MLTSSELAQMRATADRALPATAVIETQTWVSDQGGGGSVSWTASGTVDCRLAPIRGTEREQGDRISPDADSLATLPFGAAVDRDARLRINGRIYNIAHIRERSWNLTTRVEVVEET